MPVNREDNTFKFGTCTFIFQRQYFLWVLSKLENVIQELKNNSLKNNMSIQLYKSFPEKLEIVDFFFEILGWIRRFKFWKWKQDNTCIFRYLRTLNLMILHKQYGRIPLPVWTSDPWFHKITQQLLYSIVTADKIVMKFKHDIKSLLGLC